MPNKVTIRVEVSETRPWRPVKSLGLMLMELRSKIGLGQPTKFRPDTNRGGAGEVRPPASKRVRD